MANPLLNDKRLDEATKRSTVLESATAWNPPVTDGPASPWPAPTAVETMTVRGTASATAVLLGLLLVAAGFGWAATGSPNDPTSPGFPGLAMVGVIVGLIAVIVSSFKPQWARVLGPVYALAEGFFVGAVSRTYENYYDGIVVQAAGATVAVFVVMLGLYRLEVIKVTDKFRRIVMGATLGLMLFYVVSMVLRLFGAEISFLRSASLLGIGFSVFVAALAAFNLALDFDTIERGAKQRMPKHMEWFAALGLLVTIVWLYLEILRLLAKLRDR